MIYKVPAAPEQYLQYQDNGIDVYISKAAARGASHIEFVLKGIWIFKGIVAEGINYPKV